MGPMWPVRIDRVVDSWIRGVVGSRSCKSEAQLHLSDFHDYQLADGRSGTPRCEGDRLFATWPLTTSLIAARTLLPLPPSGRSLGARTP